MQFHEPDIYNYSALLLSEYKDTLYIGAREAVFAVNALNISEKQHEVRPGLPCMSTQPGLSGQPPGPTVGLGADLPGACVL